MTQMATGFWTARWVSPFCFSIYLSFLSPPSSVHLALCVLSLSCYLQTPAPKIETWALRHSAAVVMFRISCVMVLFSLTLAMFEVVTYTDIYVHVDKYKKIHTHIYTTNLWNWCNNFLNVLTRADLHCIYHNSSHSIHASLCYYGLLWLEGDGGTRSCWLARWKVWV